MGRRRSATGWIVGGLVVAAVAAVVGVILLGERARDRAEVVAQQVGRSDRPDPVLLTVGSGDAEMPVVSADPGEQAAVEEAVPAPDEAVVQGRVETLAGDPVEGAGITVRDPAARLNGVPQIVATATTDAAGRFVLRGLPRRDKLWLNVGATPGNTTTSGSVDTSSGGVVALDPLTVRRLVRVRVEVSGPSGAPVAGARLYVGHPEAGDFIQHVLLGQLQHVAETDASGVAEIGVAPEQTFRIAAAATDAYPVETTFEAHHTMAPVSLELGASAPVRGVVLDAKERPVVRARIHCSFDDGSGTRRTAHTETDAAGRFEVPWVSPRPVKVEVTTFLFRTKEITSEMPREDLRVLLTPYSADGYEALRPLFVEYRRLQALPDPDDPEMLKAHREAMNSLDDRLSKQKDDYPCPTCGGACGDACGTAGMGGACG